MIQRLKPACKDYLWGGVRLKEEYGKQCAITPLAETWELSAHPDGESRIAGGIYDDMLFSAYIKTCGKEILGKKAERFAKFPVLIKFIDAKQPLSLQVHPDDAFAMMIEGEYGKTEMWYVMDCEPGAFLYLGVNQMISREAFCRRVNNQTVEQVLNKIPVKKGDVFFIEPGTLHAIGAGILICEIQQSSNTTYRVYDYGRRDAAGNLRALHMEKALAVANLSPVQPQQDKKQVVQEKEAQHRLLEECPYFTTKHYECRGTVTLEAGEESFLSIVCLNGSGTAADADGTIAFFKGDSLFIPANSGSIILNGNCEWILTTL